MLMLWAARPAKQTETADNVSGCVGGAKVLHTCRRKHFKTCAKLACQLMSEYLRPIRTHTDAHSRTQTHANVPEARTKV